jgi:hypothetical protein
MAGQMRSIELEKKAERLIARESLFLKSLSIFYLIIAMVTHTNTTKQS